MEMKQDFSKPHVILCRDGYEFSIRCLKRAVDILESVQADDRYDEDPKPVYPLSQAIDVLNNSIWEKFDEMCNQKADYDTDEWMEMKRKHDKKMEEQKHPQK